MMSRVPELFRRQGALASLRPAAVQAHVQAQQRAPQDNSADQPPLLKRLLAVLADAGAAAQEKTHTAPSSSISTGAATAAARPQQQQQRVLHACHQVFELFLASMTTYRPLLLRVKVAYDEALRDAAAAACDNAYLQTKLSHVPHQHALAVAAARQAAEQQAADMEAELNHKLAQLQHQTQEVEAECARVEDQLQHMQKHMLQAHRETAQLEASVGRAHKDLVDGSSWHLLSSAVQPRASSVAAG